MKCIESGKLVSVVDRSFPLEHAAKAHRFAESGAKTGYVAISVSP
jgi:NADPH:quinone reductase-like Zn-dependent oxidoreductase